MQITESSPELADAADVLSDQLRTHLLRLADILEPHADSLDASFLKILSRQSLNAKIRSALLAITPGAAARSLAQDLTPAAFIEQVEYNGRRLAKLNLPPSEVIQALQEYDRLLSPVLESLDAAECANLQWVREQLQFCTILTLNNAYYQVRESETHAFYELFRVELESHHLDELLRRFLETLLQWCHADAAHLYLWGEGGSSRVLRYDTGSDQDSSKPAQHMSVPGRIARRLSSPKQLDPAGKDKELVLDASWSSKYRWCWSVPLALGERMSGVMQFVFVKPYEWLPREQELLSGAAERCLLAAEKARLVENLAAREEQVRELAEHMLHVEERERRRISRELHDETGQSLLCMRLQMEMLEHALPPERTEWILPLREIRDLTERTILEMRRLIAALSPAVLEQLGLGAALRQLVTRFRRLSSMKVKLQLLGLNRLPQSTEIIVYRLVQECFNNIAKHSHATTVNISVGVADGMVRLEVRDNGVGFRVEEALATRETFGLAGMRERVALLGGIFEVVSHPAGANKRTHGTRILMSLPIPEERPAVEGQQSEKAEARRKPHSSGSMRKSAV